MENKLLSIDNPKYLKTHSDDSCGHCNLGFSLFDDLVDWGTAKWEQASGYASDLIDTISEGGGEFYDNAIDVVDSGMDTINERLNEAKVKVEELKEKQKEVDLIIEATNDPVEKEELILKRDEARGIFTTYVLPLFDKLIDKEKEVKVDIEAEAKEQGMGALPLVLVPALWSIGMKITVTVMVGLTLAVIYYTSQAFAIESEIINDSSLSPSEKAALLEKIRATGSVSMASKAVQSLKWSAIIGSIGLISYSLFK